MNMNTNYHNYDKFPFIKAQGKAFSGYEEIKNEISKSNERVIVFDCYPIVDVKAIVNGIGDMFDCIFLQRHLCLLRRGINGENAGKPY